MPEDTEAKKQELKWGGNWEKLGKEIDLESLERTHNEGKGRECVN